MATAKDILARKGNNVVTVKPTETVLQAAQRMNERRIGAVVVCEAGEHLIGILSERDILTRVVAESRPPDATMVSEIMTTKVFHCTPETSVEECQEIMTRLRLRHLPVIKGGQLVGMISIGDLMAHEAAQQQVTIEYMHQYIHGRT